MKRIIKSLCKRLSGDPPIFEDVQDTKDWGYPEILQAGKQGKKKTKSYRNFSYQALFKKKVEKAGQSMIRREREVGYFLFPFNVVTFPQKSSIEISGMQLAM